MDMIFTECFRSGQASRSNGKVTDKLRILDELLRARRLHRSLQVREPESVLLIRFQNGIGRLVQGGYNRNGAGFEHGSKLFNDGVGAIDISLIGVLSPAGVSKDTRSLGWWAYGKHIR